MFQGNKNTKKLPRFFNGQRLSFQAVAPSVPKACADSRKRLRRQSHTAAPTVATGTKKARTKRRCAGLYFGVANSGYAT